MSENKKYAIYWHKGMNSGLWTGYTYIEAKRMAQSLAKQESMYEVQVIEHKSIEVIKNERN